jgi:hypothetical protein
MSRRLARKFCLNAATPKQETMKIGDRLLKQLRRQYKPDTLITQKIGKQDAAFKTDDQGNPVILFIGKMDPDGKIAGERFTRVLLKDADGKIIKDHWDRKGNT